MKISSAAILVFIVATVAHADVGDPQVRTDHPWYPGELACSTFERLFEAQAKLYEHVVGQRPTTDQEKAIAAWLWRNSHYWHGEEGAEDLWGEGFGKGGDSRTREYWTGMFAHGFGLCGTTHSQWVAEMEALFGHTRGRAVGTAGHSSFEVFLKGGPYGKGRWALLDHDISTIIFDQKGEALLSIADVQPDWKRWTDRRFMPKRQNGWLVCGLHPNDGGVYQRYRVAEYLAGYSGVPPIVHLRRGEVLRRYVRPVPLGKNKSYVFWGRNYNTAEIPGPERAHTWVNQPDKMYKSTKGAGYRPGQARFANAVYIYAPNFSTGDYKEGVSAENDEQVTFEFYTPYIIAATPPNDKAWGIYHKGCKNGLVLRGKAKCKVSLSTDQGKTWSEYGVFRDGMDLTDFAKGHRQYFLRFHAPASKLKGTGLTIETVCQMNSSILPRLKDSGCRVTFQAGGQAVLSAGPNLPQAQAHVIDGKFGSPKVTMNVATPRGESIAKVYAAAHVQSGSPPRKGVRYHIEYSIDAGKTFKPIVKDWEVTRRGHEPGDYWSQSFCWGSTQMKGKASNVFVRFRNTGGRRYARCEVHLVYRTPSKDPTKVTFAWHDERGAQEASKVFAAGEGTQSWEIPTSKNVQTDWVEYRVAR